MRWAVLKLTSGRPSEILQTGTIALELMGGGFTSSTNFSSKLSAILGQMVNKGEMEKTAAGWRITPNGVKAWEVISVSERYQNRGSFSDSSEESEDRSAVDDDITKDLY